MMSVFSWDSFIICLRLQKKKKKFNYTKFPNPLFILPVVKTNGGIKNTKTKQKQTKNKNKNTKSLYVALTNMCEKIDKY